MTSLTASQKRHQGNAPAHHAQLCLPPRYRRDSQRTHHTHHGAVGVPCQKRMVRRCGSAWHSSGIPGSRGLHKKHAHRFFRRSTPRRKTWRKTDDREGIPQDQTGEVCPSESYFSGKGWLHHATAKKITARGCLVISAPSTTTGLEKRKENQGTHAQLLCFFFQAGGP